VKEQAVCYPGYKSMTTFIGKTATDTPSIYTDGNDSIWPPVQAKTVQLTDHGHCHKSQTNTTQVAGP